MREKRDTLCLIIGIALAFVIAAFPFILEGSGMKISMWIWWIVEALAILTIIIALLWYYLEKVKLWFPQLQFFKTDTLTTIRIEKKSKEGKNLLRDIKYSPENWIFPSIQLISLSPILNNLYYLDIIGSLPSALPYNLILKDVWVQLFIMTGELSPKQPINVQTRKQRIIEGDNTNKSGARKTITINAENQNELSNFRICLNEKAREQVIEIFHQNKAVKATLTICGKDDKDKLHYLSTRQVSIALLNGGELYKNDTKTA